MVLTPCEPSFQVTFIWGMGLGPYLRLLQDPLQMIPVNYWWPQKMSITKICLPPVLLPALKEDQGRCSSPPPPTPAFN